MDSQEEVAPENSRDILASEALRDWCEECLTSMGVCHLNSLPKS